MSRAPHRRSPFLRALGSCWRDASAWSIAVAHESVGRVLLGLTLRREARFSRARRWFDAAASWLPVGVDGPAETAEPSRTAQAGGSTRGWPGSGVFGRLLTGTAFRLRIALAHCAHGMGDYLAWRRECGRARQLDPRRFAALPHPYSLFEIVQPHLTAWDRRAWHGSTRDGGDGHPAAGRGGLVLGRPGLGTPEEVGVTRPGDGEDPTRRSRPSTHTGSEAAGGSGSGRGVREGDHSGPAGGAAEREGDAGDDGRWLEHVLREFERVLGPGRTDADPRPSARGPDDCSDDGERRRFDALGPVEPEEILRADLDSLARRLQASDPAP